MFAQVQQLLPGNNVLFQVHNGYQFTILQEQNGWYQVSFGADRNWLDIWTICNTYLNVFITPNLKREFPFSFYKAKGEFPFIQIWFLQNAFSKSSGACAFTT